MSSPDIKVPDCAGHLWSFDVATGAPSQCHRAVVVLLSSVWSHLQEDETGKKFVKYEVIGDNNVAVPTHLFKIIVCEDPIARIETPAHSPAPGTNPCWPRFHSETANRV